MADVGTAWVAIKPAVKGFGSALAKQTSGEVDSAGKGIGSKFGTAMKLGVAAAVTTGIAATTVFLKKSMDAAGEARKVGKLTEAVIKSTGGVAHVTAEQVDEQAQSLANLTGQNKESIQSGENMLLTFRNIRNEQGKGNDIFNQSTEALTNLSAVMGTEPKRAAIQLGKALNDPIKGMSSLGRMGVQFTQEQKDQAKAMVESGNTMGAQKMILKELGKEFGGAAESQATSGAKLKVAMTELEVTVGTALIPVMGALKTALTYLVQWINSRVVPAFSALGGWITPITDSFKAWLEVLFSAKGEAGGIGQSVDDLSSSLGSNLLPVLKALADTFMTVILPALIQLGGYLARNLVPIFNAVASIVAHQILPIYRIFYTFIVAQLIPAVMEIVQSVAKSLKPAFDQLFKSLQGLMPAISQLLAKLKQYLPVVLKVVLFVLKLVGWLLKLAAIILGKVLPIVIRLAAFLIKVLVKAIIVTINIIAAIVRAIINVVKWFDAAGKAVNNFARDIAHGIATAIKWVDSIGDKVNNAVRGFGTLLVHAGEELINGLIRGITNKLGELASKMSEVGKKVKGFLPGSPVKEGPLTAWNRKSPGATLVERIAEGLGQTSSIDAAMTKLAGRAQLTAGGSLAAAGAASGGGLSGQKLRLVVDGYEFNAYVDARADDRVASSSDLDDQRGRAAWLSRR